MAAERNSNTDLAIFSDTDSEFENFEGFDARDTRPYAEIASKAPLYHSTPQPKAKRVCRATINTSDSSNSDESSNISPVEDVRPGNASSSSSVEGEIAPLVYKVNVCKSMLPQASNNKESDTSSSSVEGETYIVEEETVGKKPPLHVSQDGFASLGADTTISATSVFEQTIADETPKTATGRRGKHRSTVCTPEELLKETCCKETFCLQKLLTVNQMKKAREHFCQDYPTYELQRQFLFNWLDDNQPTAGVFRYYISGIKVCWSAWTKVLGITRRRFFELKREFLLGRRCARHGASLTTKDCPQSEAVINFLDRYFAENCDYMPNSSMWHLTSSSRKNEVFKEFQETTESTGQPSCSESLFRKIWNERYSHVKIPKENRFSKCDTCCNLKVEIRGTTNPIQKQAIDERRKSHIAWVREERKAYMSRCSQAHHQPNKYFSVAIDGMDTTKTELPFSAHRHGTAQKAWHLRVHIVGVLIHGRHPICFLDYHQFPHDSNLLINVLLQTLWVHRELLGDCLFLQLDNTAKENKNQYVFCFLGYLVETGVFETIEISFLPVGHTHIDVDQMFSRISVATEKSGCLTPQDLLRIIRRCYKQAQGETTQEGARAQYATTPHLYAVREWLLPHLPHLHGLNSFHSFAIVRNTEGKAVLHFKAWSTSQWEAEAYEPVELLRTTPTGLPDLIKPNYGTVDLPKLKSMVEKCANNGILNTAEKEEWMAFLKMEQEQADVYESVEERNIDGSKYHKKELVYLPCSDEKWIVDDLRTRERPSGNTPQLSDVLKRSEAFERGDGLLPVYTGSYRRPGQVQRQVLRNESRGDIGKGMLVAVVLNKYPEKPLIGRVDEVSGEKLHLTWMYGHWTTNWSICKKREGQRMVEWTEQVDKSAVVLFDFELTSSGKLRLATVRELKRVYGLQQISDSE